MICEQGKMTRLLTLAYAQATTHPVDAKYVPTWAAPQFHANCGHIRTRENEIRLLTLAYAQSTTHPVDAKYVLTWATPQFHANCGHI